MYKVEEHGKTIEVHIYIWVDTQYLMNFLHSSLNCEIKKREIKVLAKQRNLVDREKYPVYSIQG